MSDDTLDLDYVDANLTSTQAWDGEGGVVENGDYLLKITDVVRKSNKAGSGVNLVIDYEIRAMDNGSDTAMKGRTLKAWYAEQGEGMKRLKQLLNAVPGVENANGGYSPKKLKGKSICATVIAESYNRQNPVTLEDEKRMSSKVKKERPAPANLQ